MHDATKYAQDVVSGKIIACKWVILSCQRHLDDFRRDDIYFDEGAAEKAIGFIQTLYHYSADMAGMRFMLLDWQKFVVGSIFGWKRRRDDKRKYNYAFVEIPRKNGKTLLAAAISLYLLCADGEAGAEIYFTATKKQQSAKCWKDVQKLIQRSRNPALISAFNIRQAPANIEYIKGDSYCLPLGRDKEGLSMDGLSPHGIVMDEIHAWKDIEYYNVLVSALGARSQPLVLMITTAGILQNGVGKKKETLTKQVLEGVLDADDWFGIIYTIDEGDDIEDPKTWAKANPCFGVTVNKFKFEAEIKKCEKDPAGMRNFKIKYLNIWVYELETWLNMDSFKKCNYEYDKEDLKGMRCYGGLDLAQVNDLSAFVLLFPPQEGLEHWAVLSWFWIPEENLREMERISGNQYRTWSDQGLINTTPGNVTDYNFVQKDIVDVCENYDVEAIAFDRTFSGQIVQNLQDDLGDDMMVQFSQGFMTISSPSKELERMVLGEELNHLGDPIITWMASNTVVSMNAHGSIKPDKSKSENKIDGIVCLVMALGLSQEMEDEACDFSSGLDSW